MESTATLTQAQHSVGWLDAIATPAYVCDEALIRANLEKIASVKSRTGCQFILALKAFAMPALFPLMREYLDGATASSLHETILASREFGKEVHVYAPAYRDQEFQEILGVANHITFNSMSQWARFEPAIRESGRKVPCGIRINPEYSEVSRAIYNPCAPYSRFGVTADQCPTVLPPGITGLHMHALCESGSDSLERVMAAVESKFKTQLLQAKWLNLGGGHHITRPGYDIDKLCEIISYFKSTYQLDVILEPGSAMILNAGTLVASVLDITHNGMSIAILDTSATAHMPDVLEMPYRPDVVDAGFPGAKPYTYRLGGLTCLSGDVIGDFSFDAPLEIGQKLIFQDMIQYSIVKNTSFNGIPLPSLTVLRENGNLDVIRTFGYDDFASRLM